MAARGVVVLFLVSVLACAGTVSVEIRDSEVWLIRDGRARQLTADGKAKLQAALSPAADRVAYYEECPEVEHCMPSVVILNLEGHRLASFQAQMGAAPPESPCASILSIAWVGESAIAAECHINPSLSEYIETEISTGRKRRDLLGYDFTPSPDGKLVAHVGWIIHFAPPYAQSNYLQIEDTTIYPLPEGVKPAKQKILEQPPEVVRKAGETYTGIHEFLPGFHWSPDSRRIAFFDCTYNWTPDSPEAQSAAAGRESDRRCGLAVVSTDGEAHLFPLADISPRDLADAQVSWAGAHELSLNVNGTPQTFHIRGE